MKNYKLALLFGCALAVVALVAGSSVFAQDNVAVISPQGNLSQPTVVADKSYKVHEDDILRIDVWGEPQLSNMQMQVTSDGRINVPYIGDIRALDRTQKEITDEISSQLENKGILVKPKVVITLITMHRPTVRVLGAVSRSGEFQFKEDKDRILDAVAQAGYQDTSWLEHATLTHRGEDKSINIDVQKIVDGIDYSQNFLLKDGDVINIPPEDYQNKIYVMGQVNRPMMYDLKENTTVMTAINLAGGQTERASLRSTMVIRTRPDGKPEKRKCDLVKLFDKGDRSQDIQLLPGDVVYVPETNKPNWNKVSQILGTITNLTYIRRYGLF